MTEAAFVYDKELEWSRQLWMRLWWVRVIRTKLFATILFLILHMDARDNLPMKQLGPTKESHFTVKS